MSDYWIQTYCGRRFDFNHIRTEDISIIDIASALSKLCRFNGHCTEFYSVAEHSLYVSSLLPKELRLEGLLHDAAEAYTGDLTKPLKCHPTLRLKLKAIENWIELAIASVFNLKYPFSLLIHKADMALLADEYEQIMTHSEHLWHLSEPPAGIRLKLLTHEEARAFFMDEFMRLKR